MFCCFSVAFNKLHRKEYVEELLRIAVTHSLCVEDCDT